MSLRALSCINLTALGLQRRFRLSLLVQSRSVRRLLLRSHVIILHSHLGLGVRPQIDAFDWSEVVLDHLSAIVSEDELVLPRSVHSLRIISGSVSKRLR